MPQPLLFPLRIVNRTAVRIEQGVRPMPNPQFKIGGVTKDSTGAMLPSCDVDLFRTADDVRVDSLVSDAAGAFSFTTAAPGRAYYVVAYKAGAPDVAGTTVNTLTATQTVPDVFLYAGEPAPADVVLSDPTVPRSGGSPQTVPVGGRSSVSTFGAVTAGVGGVSVTVSGRTSTSSYGAAAALPGGVSAAPAGWTSASSFGAITPTVGPVTVAVGGLTTATAYGQVTIGVFALTAQLIPTRRRGR